MICNICMLMIVNYILPFFLLHLLLAMCRRSTFCGLTFWRRSAAEAASIRSRALAGQKESDKQNGCQSGRKWYAQYVLFNVLWYVSIPFHTLISGLILQLFYSFVYLVFDILWHFVWSQRNSSQAAESSRNTKDALAMHALICSFHQFLASRRLSSLAVWQHPRAKGPAQLQERQS